jgi:chaperonin GroES
MIQIKMNSKKVKPIADRFLIEPMKPEDKTKCGILIPDTAKEKPQQGKVIAAGKGTKDIKMPIKSGDIVLYGKFSGTEFQIDGLEYLFIKLSDIYATIKS